MGALGAAFFRVWDWDCDAADVSGVREGAVSWKIHLH